MAFMHTRVLTVALLTVVLGLLGGPFAEGSCAGPQFSVLDASFTPVPWLVGPRRGADVQRAGREAGHGPRQQLWPLSGHVRRQWRRLRPTVASASSGGARDRGRRSPPSRQGSRRWSLGLADATAPSLAIDYLVNLPQDLKPGRATLNLTGPTLLGDVSVWLEVS